MNSDDFIKFLKRLSLDGLSVLNTSIPKSKFIPLDLSETNDELKTIDVSSSEKLGIYVNNYIKTNNAQVAFGGYLEKRNIYKRSNHFNKKEDQERNIHLGVDLWCDVETPVYTPFDATLHSFNNNTNYGDYGPTIVLKHRIMGNEFYTLYGHLSLNSLNNLEAGKVFKKGDKIATLGETVVNGDYPPHLHFQIIKEIQNFKGDYPGVCSKTDLEFYQNNCPNPNLLLKLNY
ncbi:MAG: peptidoglycan DD-metalloendopeptidase family protein [Flaviramulus sp.]|nr:peptidoglycan DD-metalloendopeptidase family protein [Flaviramulus sp.]NNC51014.1 peptidoglycan DD-metalloendopeptidase family protein [Flaviramulus sp.]